MEGYHYPEIRKHQAGRKRRLSQEQVRLLETHFSANNKLEPERKSQLALQLGIPARQVAVWYQNKRAREKTLSLEMEHRALQEQLESVLNENATLMREAQRLMAELTRERESYASLVGYDLFGN